MQQENYIPDTLVHHEHRHISVRREPHITCNQIERISLERERTDMHMGCQLLEITPDRVAGGPELIPPAQRSLSNLPQTIEIAVTVQCGNERSQFRMTSTHSTWTIRNDQTCSSCGQTMIIEIRVLRIGSGEVIAPIILIVGVRIVVIPSERG